MNKFPLLSSMMFQDIQTKSKTFLSSFNCIVVTICIFSMQLTMGKLMHWFKGNEGEVVFLSLMSCFFVVIIVSTNMMRKEFIK